MFGLWFELRLGLGLELKKRISVSIKSLEVPWGCLEGYRNYKERKGITKNCNVWVWV